MKHTPIASRMISGAARPAPIPSKAAPQSFCMSCDAFAEIADDGTCKECLSIVDLVRWQDAEEAFRSDARAAEIAERLDPVDPFFAADRGGCSGYWRAL